MATARFFDGRSARPHAVSLDIHDDVLLIRATDGSLAEDWPLPQLVARIAPGGGVTLRRGDAPARLQVDDPVLRQRLAPGPRVRRRLTGWRLAGLAGAVLAAALYLVIDAGPQLLARAVPGAWEARWGQAIEHGMLARSRQCTRADGQRALDGLLARIAAVSGVAAVDLVVLDDPRVNAFTLPGHRIVLLRGLIDEAHDGDELAGVLAHETGHIAHRDPARQLLREVGFSLIAASLGLGSLDSGGVAQTLLSLSYGRAAESAADAFAIATLQAAGLRADGLARFFVATGPSSEIAFLSDHPPTAERRAAVTVGPNGQPAFDPSAWAAIRGMCRR